MEDRPLEGRRRVAAALRTLAAQIVTVDLDDARLDEIGAELERLRITLQQAPRLERQIDGLHTHHAKERSGREPLYDRDPMIGLSNPLSPPLRRVGGRDQNEWQVTFGDAYEGHPGFAHGGYVAAVIDHVLGVAASSTGLAAMTGTLSARYRLPTPLHTELVCKGGIDRTEGRKVFCSATLEANGRVVAEGEGIFFRVEPDRY